VERQSAFEWDATKDKVNQEEHGVSLAPAQIAFLDHHRLISENMEHGGDEKRNYCLGRFVGSRMGGPPFSALGISLKQTAVWQISKPARKA